MKWYGRCPFCRELIQLKIRKDEESFEGSEMGEHVDQMHEKEYSSWRKEQGIGDFGFPWFDEGTREELTQLLH